MGSRIVILSILVLQINCISDAQSSALECFKHEDCRNGTFCGWMNCPSFDGMSYPCGTCRNCSECACHRDSIDFECPVDRCPYTPNDGIRYLQGLFLNISDMSSAPGYTCNLRLAITGNVFTLLQIPVYNLHPVTTATFSSNADLEPECPTISLTGVLHASDLIIEGVLLVNVTLSSQGAQKTREYLEFCITDLQIKATAIR